jgi:hypothetical protein
MTDFRIYHSARRAANAMTTRSLASHARRGELISPKVCHLRADFSAVRQSGFPLPSTGRGIEGEGGYVESVWQRVNAGPCSPLTPLTPTLSPLREEGDMACPSSFGSGSAGLRTPRPARIRKLFGQSLRESAPRGKISLRQRSAAFTPLQFRAAHASQENRKRCKDGVLKRRKRRAPFCGDGIRFSLSPQRGEGRGGHGADTWVTL